MGWLISQGKILSGDPMDQGLTPQLRFRRKNKPAFPSNSGYDLALTSSPKWPQINPLGSAAPKGCKEITKTSDLCVNDNFWGWSQGHEAPCGCFWCPCTAWAAGLKHRDSPCFGMSQNSQPRSHDSALASFTREFSWVCLLPNVTHSTDTSQCKQGQRLGVLRKDAQIKIKKENHLHLRK